MCFTGMRFDTAENLTWAKLKVTWKNGYTAEVPLNAPDSEINHIHSAVYDSEIRGFMLLGKTKTQKVGCCIFLAFG